MARQMPAFQMPVCGIPQSAHTGACTMLLDSVSTLQVESEAGVDVSVLTALALAWHDTHNLHVLSVDFEGHGREDFGNHDVSHTVGWFTSLFPRQFEVSDAADVARCVRQVGVQYASANAAGGFGFTVRTGGLLSAESVVPPVAYNFVGGSSDDVGGNEAAPGAWWMKFGGNEGMPHDYRDALMSWHTVGLNLSKHADGALGLSWSLGERTEAACHLLLSVFEQRLREVVAAVSRDVGQVTFEERRPSLETELSKPQRVAAHSRLVVLRSHVGAATKSPLWLVHALSGSVEPVRDARRVFCVCMCT